MLTKLRRRIAPFITKVQEVKGLFVLVAIVVVIFFAGQKILPFLGKSLIIARFITELLFNKTIELKKEERGTINILLLGIAGGNHDGANLTDTIIFAHIDPESNEQSSPSGKGKVVLVSIPRDLWIPLLESKVNAAYEFGEDKKKGGGLTLAKATLSDIIGEPVGYGIRIDFSGFVKILDQVGGLDIDVDQAFDDYNYPIPEKEKDLCGKTEGETLVLLATISATPAPPISQLFPCRVEHLHFDKGKTHMDGATALKYVRSRQAQGSEGTDFARSRRQQKVLIAFRDKVLSLGILLNPFKLIQISQTLGKSIDTDIKTSEFDDFVKLAQKLHGAKVKTVVIDQGDEEKERIGLLLHPAITQDYQNRWVLIPRVGNGDFSEIQNYVSCELTKDNCGVDK